MSTNVSGVSSNFFPTAQNGFTTTTSASVGSGATTVGLNSVAGYTNGEVVVLVIDPTDASKKQTFTGVVDTAGSQITSVKWTAGTNQSHLLGATVVDYETATHWALYSKGLLVDHSQAGAHEFTTVYDPSNPTLETLKLAGVSSAVNEVTITNAATGNFPTISATGEADTGIDFENSEGEEILKLDAVASAVNEITIKNAVTTANPEILASGGDTNIGIKLTPKGSGDVLIPLTIAFRAYTSATFNSSTSATKVAFNTEDFDAGGDYDATTNYRFTAPVTGYYAFYSQISLQDPGDLNRMLIHLYKNGVLYTERQTGVSGAATDPGVNLYDVVSATAGDYFEIYFSTTTGGITSLNSRIRTFFGGHFLGV